MLSEQMKSELKIYKSNFLKWLDDYHLGLNLLQRYNSYSSYQNNYDYILENKNNIKISLIDMEKEKERFFASFNCKLNFYGNEHYSKKEILLNFYEYIYKNKIVDKSFLISNINELTDSEWKSDFKFILKLGNKEEQKNLLLNIDNTTLGFNLKNLNNIYKILNLSINEEKIKFWQDFLKKRKVALKNNKSATIAIVFLEEHFSIEEIKNNFKDVTPYIESYYDNNFKIEDNLILDVPEYIKKIKFNSSDIEKKIKIPNFHKNKINDHLKEIIKWISHINGYKNQIIENNPNNTEILIISSSPIKNIDIIKNTVFDYIYYLKSNNNHITTEEDFSKWYLKNKIENDLKMKGNKISSKKI